MVVLIVVVLDIEDKERGVLYCILIFGVLTSERVSKQKQVRRKEEQTQ